MYGEANQKSTTWAEHDLAQFSICVHAVKSPTAGAFGTALENSYLSNGGSNEHYTGDYPTCTTRADILSFSLRPLPCFQRPQPTDKTARLILTSLL
jgi:hypothetical protein